MMKECGSLGGLCKASPTDVNDDIHIDETDDDDDADNDDYLE